MDNNIDRIFQALGDSTRRAMLAQMSAGPVSVTAMAQASQITRAAVLQHLQVLEACELVQTHKVGRVRTGQINPAGIARAHQWLDERSAFTSHQNQKTDL